MDNGLNAPEIEFRELGECVENVIGDPTAVLSHLLMLPKVQNLSQERSMRGEKNARYSHTQEVWQGLCTHQCCVPGKWLPIGDQQGCGCHYEGSKWSPNVVLSGGARHHWMGTLSSLSLTGCDLQVESLADLADP
jgi:hypothetical protein